MMDPVTLLVVAACAHSVTRLVDALTERLLLQTRLDLTRAAQRPWDSPDDAHGQAHRLPAAALERS